MSLINPVEILAPKELGPVHFIAIGGAGMSGIARIMVDLKITVSGSDQADSPVLTELSERGARVHVGHHRDQLGTAQTVVVSSAVPPDNPELVAATERGLRIWHRSAALASVMTDSRVIAVAGTHGKTTTSAMIATMLTEAGLDPSYVIGAPLADAGLSSHLGRGEFFVVEADESDGSFLQYQPEIVVVTNVEADHLDNWVTPQAYADGFERFVATSSVRGFVVSIDDPGSRLLWESAKAADVGTITYGESPEADLRLHPGGPGRAVLESVAGGQGELRLAVPGRYNLHNATAAWAVGQLIGLEERQLSRGLAAFGGTHRRFQPVGSVRGVLVFDDYAHHPTEVAATLAAAREAYAGRLIACFQPHLFSRTRDFAAEFGRALRIADEVVVLDIYPAREQPIAGVTSQLVVDAMIAAEPSRAPSVHASSWGSAATTVAGLAAEGDVILTIGAGDVTDLGPIIVTALEAADGG